jgi:hypothetical protein
MSVVSEINLFVDQAIFQILSRNSSLKPSYNTVVMSKDYQPYNSKSNGLVMMKLWARMAEGGRKGKAG